MIIKPDSTMEKSPLVNETVWLDKYKYDDAELHYAQERCRGREGYKLGCKYVRCSLIDQIEFARQHIRESLQSGSNYSGCETVSHVDMVNHVRALQSETQEIRKILTDVKSFVESLEVRLKKIEGLEAVLKAHGSVPAAKQHAPAQKKEAPKPENKSAGDEDDDLDLFGSDEDEEADAVREQRLKAYQEKKSKKPGPIAKSSVVIDVKPWDDETDMGELEKQVRGIEMDGLVWGASKLVPLAYGIRKLQIVCIVEDEKVSIDELQETIQEMEDLVQSTDIAAFNKL